MAQINRFYLLIAALLCARTYSAMAFSCDDTDKPQECWNIYTQNSISYSELRNNGWSTATCLRWDGWSDSDGNPLPDSMCEEFDDSELAFMCCDMDEDCWRWLTGIEECVGGGGSGDIEIPTCADGYWLNEQTISCEKCPNYDYYAGTFTGTLGGADRYPDVGTDRNISLCYVPPHKTFADRTGAYEFVRNCYYSGSY